MAAVRKLERRVTKEKKAKLTKKQREQQNELQSREKALADKAEAFKKEQEELNAYRRKMVMENVTSFGLNTAELNAFVSALDGFQQKTDLAVAIVNAAKTAGGVDMGQLQTKLVRLGFL